MTSGRKLREKDGTGHRGYLHEFIILRCALSGLTSEPLFA